ncbi:MAG: hypothetical protein AABX33_00815 [Nanoarchaeota archaeon]
MKLITIAFASIILILIAPSALANGLEITEVDVHVNYDDAFTYRVENRDRKNSGTLSMSNGSKIDVDVLPGSTVTFTIRVENTFEGDKTDLRGVFATVTIKDIDDDSDLDKESVDFDLEPGNDYRFDVEFKIPIDVDSGTYDVVIEAEGDDRNGTSYKAELNQKLEVKKQSHDIRITQVLLTPSVLDCSRKAKLTAEIVNAGSNQENQVSLEFKSANFGINSFDRDISLQSSDEASDEEKTFAKSLNIEVPSFFSAGTYPILVNLYWKNFILFDQKKVDLIVKDCIAGTAQTQMNEQEPKSEIEADEESVETIPAEEVGLENEQITATEEISIFSSPLILLIFAGGFAILILIVLIFFGYLRLKKAIEY